MGEHHWRVGPVSLLVSGRVWSLNIGRVGFYGIGLRYVRAVRLRNP